MNVGKSNDNTYAITDLSLEELAAIWHLANKPFNESIDSYSNEILTDKSWYPRSSKKPAYITKLLQQVERQDLLNVEAALWHAVDNALTDDVRPGSATGYKNRNKQRPPDWPLTNPCSEQLIVTGDNPVTMDVLIEAAIRQSERMQKDSKRGKK
jgi:hypothetical protein